MPSDVQRGRSSLFLFRNRCYRSTISDITMSITKMYSPMLMDIKYWRYVFFVDSFFELCSTSNESNLSVFVGLNRFSTRSSMARERRCWLFATRMEHRVTSPPINLVKQLSIMVTKISASEGTIQMIFLSYSMRRARQWWRAKFRGSLFVLLWNDCGIEMAV